MAGIMQNIISSRGEKAVGYRGRSAFGKSMVFGSTAGTALVSGDTTKMSSLNVSGLPAIGSGSWTIEYWLKFSNIQFNEGIVHQSGQVILSSVPITNGLVILHTADAVKVNNNIVTVADMKIPASSVQTQAWGLNTWYHVAIVRNGTALTCWINGNRTTSGVITDNNVYSELPIEIGTWLADHGLGTTNNFIGSLYNFRIVNGSAVYDTASTTIPVPSLPLALYSTTTRLLMLSKDSDSNLLIDSSGSSLITPMAGTVLGSSMTPFSDVVSVTSATLSYSSPFVSAKSGSYLFSGTGGSYVSSTGGPRFAVGTGDFTVEWFAYQLNTNSNPSAWWYGTSSLGIEFESSEATADVKLYAGGSSVVLAAGLAKGSYIEQWTHWAVVRLSGSSTLYRNGISVGSVAFSTDITDSASTFYIGNRGPSSTNNQSFNGYITNVRIIKGVGTYTGSFTVPTNNLLRVQTTNYYGGSNTSAVRSEQVALLMVP